MRRGTRRPVTSRDQGTRPIDRSPTIVGSAEDPGPGAGDDDLLARLRAGDADAWAALWQRYYPRMTAFALKHLGSLEDAEDVASEALVRTLARFSIVAPPRSLSAYLVTVTRNLSHDTVRRRVREEQVADRVVTENRLAAGGRPGVHRDEPEAFLDTRSGVVRALATIPARQRLVLVLLALEDRTVAEAAEALGLTTNATSQLAYRARRSMIDALARRPVAGPHRDT